jgi:hypothetical protein
MRQNKEVPLDAFSFAGLKRAAAARRAPADEVISLTPGDNGIVRTVKADSAAMKSALADEEMSFADMLSAKNRFIDAMISASWDRSAIVSFAGIFRWAEHTEEAQDPEHGQQMVLNYIAEQKRSWYELVDQGEEPFDLAVFNEELFQKIKDKYWLKHNASVATKVSSFRRSCENTTLTA